MSETNVSKPRGIALHVEAGAGSRIINKPGQVGGASAPQPNATRAPLMTHRRGGQFGATSGVQINSRSPVSLARIPPQTLSVLRSTLATVEKFCAQSDSQSGVYAVKSVLELLSAIERGIDISDHRQHAPQQAPQQAPATPSSPTASPAPSEQTTPAPASDPK